MAVSLQSECTVKMQTLFAKRWHLQVHVVLMVDVFSAMKNGVSPPAVYGMGPEVIVKHKCVAVQSGVKKLY